MSDKKTGGCPVMHGSVTKLHGRGQTNKDWWPNQLNLSILHQHNPSYDPMAGELDYAAEFKKLRMSTLCDGAVG